MTKFELLAFKLVLSPQYSVVYSSLQGKGGKKGSKKAKGGKSMKANKAYQPPSVFSMSMEYRLLF